MQELEKILKKIEKLKKMYKESSLSLIDKGNLPCEYDKSDIESAKMQAISEAITIIRKHMNDGWIPVEERLPEEKKSVLVQWEKYDRHLNVTLTYLDVMWLEDEEDVVFETINGIPNGRVIAWQPLPEPYRPERSDNHDGE